MRNFLFYFLLVEISFLLEGTIRHFPLLTIRVDLIWLMVVWIGFFVPLFPGGIWVLAIGLAREAIGAPFHGVIPCSYLAVYFFLRLSHHQLLFEKGATQIVWVVLLTLVQKGIESALLFSLGYNTPLDRWYMGHLGLNAFLQAFASLLFFPFLKKRGRMFLHAS